jgi:hypothetical protein
MRIALIAPCGYNCETNPGCHMITAGIRWLVRQAFPDAEFLPVEMMRDDPPGWRAAATCDVAILAGNPRLSLSDDAWWEDGILDRMLGLAACGIRIVDGWAGASVAPWETDETLLNHPRNRRNLKRLAHFDGVIARDAMMHRLCGAVGVRSVLLPDSTWWAADHYRVMPAEKRDGDLAIIGDGCPDADMVSACGLRIIALNAADVESSRKKGVGAELVCDPETLLRLFARSRRVLSWRIHAAIPAARLGAEVCVVAIDSRAQTVAPFCLPVITQEDIAGIGFAPTFRPANVPDTAAVVETLNGMMQ